MLQSLAPLERPTAERVYACNQPRRAPETTHAFGNQNRLVLQGLQAVPDDREIRAYDVAEASPASPGKPQIFHAANDPDRAVMVLAPDTSHGPQLRALN